MVVSFASVEDMVERSQGEITGATYPYLQKELDAATAAIQDACGWHIAPVEEKRLVRVWRFPRLVFLPAMQIVSLRNVLVDGSDYPAADVVFDSMTGETNIYARSVDLYFTAGFETVPETLRNMTLELAASGLGTALGITREQAGGVAVTYARAGALTSDDDARLASYVLQGVP